MEPDASGAWLESGEPAQHGSMAGPSGSVTYIPPPTSARIEGSGIPVGPAIAVVVILAAAGVWFARGDDAAPAVVADAAAPAPVAEPRRAPAAPKLTAVPKRRDLRNDAGVRTGPSAMAPRTKKQKETVTVIADPGPARFARADTGEVICPSSYRCKLEVDIDHVVKAKGYKPKRISGDDLYDRRGGKMRAILQPGRGR